MYCLYYIFALSCMVYRRIIHGEQERPSKITKSKMILGEKISYTECTVVKRLPAMAKIVTVGSEPITVIPKNVDSGTPLNAAKILMQIVGTIEEK